MHVNLFCLCRPPPVMRENSFLVGRDRSKSMEGGVLHPPLRERQHHLQHESLLKSDFLPPSNYNIFYIFDRLVARLNKLRVKIRRKGEDTRWTAVERKAKVIVKSVYVRCMCMCCTCGCGCTAALHWIVLPHMTEVWH